MNEMNRGTVLILGASAFQSPLADSVYAMGYRVHVASPFGNFPLVSDPRFVWHDVDVTDLEAVERLVRDHAIDMLLTDQTDLPVSVIWEVSHKLGLSGVQNGEVKAFCDKGVCREFCMRAGLFVPSFQVVSSEAELNHNWAQREVVIKPVDSQGSRGVEFLRSDTLDLGNAVKRALSFSGSGNAIIEEFIEGTEYPVEGVVCGGEYQTLAVGERRDFNHAPGIPSQCEYRPFDRSNPIHNELHNTLEAFVNSTGVQRGMTHAEVMVDRSQRCFIIEVALRSGASFIGSHIVPYLTGIDVHRTLINFAQGRDALAILGASETKGQSRVASFSYFYLEPEQLTNSVLNWPKVPGFVRHYYLPVEPTFFGCPETKNQRYGPFILFEGLESKEARLMREQFCFSSDCPKIIWD
jgi:carbamoyl-phosphate synthase large subunit